MQQHWDAWVRRSIIGEAMSRLPAWRPDMNSRATLGRRGEEVAAEHLRRRGYQILERNVRSRYGEIDLVAKDGDCLVFVEVRSVRSTALLPEESITARKRSRMARLGMLYLQEHGAEDASWRADVIAITFGSAGGPDRIEHYVNAVEES
jgi:putative endonuclease